MKRRTFTSNVALSALAGAAGLLGRSREALASAATGTVSGKVIVSRRRFRKLAPKKDHSGVVVYLEGVPGAKPRGRSKVIEIRQVDKRFVPQVAVAPVGTRVSFPNDDKTFHNVYSRSEAATFDLGQYKSGTTKVVQMKRPGVVEVYCNLHHEMRASVLIVETRHYSMTTKSGMFELRNVPVGTHRYVAWLADGDEVTGVVSVTAGNAAELTIEVTEERPRRQPDKDGRVHDYP